MTWSYLPLIGPPDPEESQQGDLEASGRIGANHNNNCGPGIFAQVFKQLGNGDPHEPQEIAGAGYLGGMTTQHIWSFFLAHRADYPKWADIAVQQGGDIVGLAASTARDWFPMVAWFWSDAAAVVKPYRTGILHWCEIIGDDGAHLVLRNPEWDTDVAITYADARAAYAGEFTIFKRRLSSLDPQEFRLITALLSYGLKTGKTPDSEAQLFAIANSMRDDLKPNAAGLSASSYVLGLLGGYAKPLANVAGPAPAVDLNGYAKVDHAHGVTGTAK